MAGILDLYNDPSNVGALSLASGLMQAGGPSPYPVSLGQALGQGYSQGLQGAQSAQQLQMQRALQSQQLIAAILGNRMMGWKANLLDSAEEGPQGAAPSAPAPSQPGMSPSTSQLTFGSPAYATPNQPQGAPQSAPGGLPLVPGMDPRTSTLAAIGMLSPGYVGAISSANQPTDVMKMLALARQGDPVAQQWIAKQTQIPPIANRGYGMMQYNPANGQYEPNLASEAQLGRTTATKESYATVPVTSAGGAVNPMFKSQLPGWPGGAQAVPAAPAPLAVKPSPQSGDPWTTMPKLQTPTGIGQSTYQKATAEKQGEAAAKLQEKYGTLAEQANQRKAFNMQALDLVDKSDTGAMAAKQADIKNYLTRFANIPESDFENTQSATLALQKDLVQAATQKAKQQFGSRITQSEVNLMLSRGSPNVDMPKAAIKYLLQSDNAMLDYQVKQSSDLGRYLSGNGDPYRFEGWYAQKFPMTSAIGSVHLGASAPAATPQQATSGWKIEKVK